LYYQAKEVVAKENVSDLLKQLYKDISYFGNGRDSFYSKISADYYGITKEDVQEFLRNQKSYQLHLPSYRPKSVAPVLTNGPRKYLQIDLVDMSNYYEFNKPYNYILTIVDIFSKYAWAVPLPNKETTTIVKAIKPILEEIKPKIIQSDNGSEFISNEFKDMIDDLGIKHLFSMSYTPQSQDQIERFNRTLKRLIFTYLTQNKSKQWAAALSALVENYNNTFYQSIKSKPVEVFNAYDDELLDYVDKKLKYEANRRVAFDDTKLSFELKPGDQVRLALKYLDPEYRKEGAKKYIAQ
jgi:hypothetical protein